MESSFSGKIILSLSIPLFILVVFSSLVGLLIPNFYSKETLNWTAQSIVQDGTDLFLISPLLIIAAVLSYKKSKTGFLLWGGAVLYLVYTFIIYCFCSHFNKLFLVYCVILGLSFYSFFYFIYINITRPASGWINNKIPLKSTGIYFIIIAVLFCFVWLSSLIPELLSNEFPKELLETGLNSNPVYVLDLSVILPAFFWIGIMLLKKREMAFHFAIAFLVFFILMVMTLGAFIVVIYYKGMASDMNLLIIFAVLALFSIYLLNGFLKNTKGNT